MVPSPTTSAEPQNCRTPPKHPPVERALEVGPPTVKPPEDVRLRDIVSGLPDACRTPPQRQPPRRQPKEHKLDPISGILPSPKAAAPQPLLLAGRESRSGKLDPILRKSPRLGTERSLRGGGEAHTAVGHVHAAREDVAAGGGEEARGGDRS